MTDKPANGLNTGRTAAFFDLDKTIIAKSSTLAFSKPFFAQGLINRRSVLKSSYAQFLFLLSGADHDQMERMREHLTAMCAGWDVEQVKAIVAETLHDIVDPLVFAEAADLIADHKLRGHDVIVVSASGEEIVAPIARALGATLRGDVDEGRRRPLHRRGRLLLLRSGQGRGDGKTRRGIRLRPRRQLRLLRLGDRFAHARGGRTSHHSQPRSCITQGSSRKRLAHTDFLEPGLASRAIVSPVHDDGRHNCSGGNRSSDGKRHDLRATASETLKSNAHKQKLVLAVSPDTGYKGVTEERKARNGSEEKDRFPN